MANLIFLSLVLSIKIRRTGHERRHRAVLTAGTPIFTPILPERDAHSEFLLPLSSL
jgi:hypothetical protein